MKMARKSAIPAALRDRIRQLERLGGAAAKTAPSSTAFGLPPIDRLWAEGGLPTGRLHDVIGAGGPSGFAAATAFTASIANRLGMVLWCSTRPDFYGPGLAQAGLAPAQLIAATAKSDADVLAVMEEGLRHAALGCVVGETSRLTLTSSRRLQLAAEKSGVTAFVLRPLSRLTEHTPIAAETRWRISAAPSAPHVIAEAGRARWTLELLHSRSGTTGQWIVEAPDAQGHLGLPSAVADGLTHPTLAPRQRLAAG
jgi:protein ImuA